MFAESVLWNGFGLPWQLLMSLLMFLHLFQPKLPSSWSLQSVSQYIYLHLFIWQELLYKIIQAYYWAIESQGPCPSIQQWLFRRPGCWTHKLVVQTLKHWASTAAIVSSDKNPDVRCWFTQQLLEGERLDRDQTLGSGHIFHNIFFSDGLYAPDKMQMMMDTEIKQAIDKSMKCGQSSSQS